MRILLIGKFGQLGWELHRALAPLGEIAATDYPEIDLARPDDIRKLVRETGPQVIVNATAYTAVDRAEDEKDQAMAINGEAPGLLAEEARRSGIVLIHYSTDYVFDGSKGSDYVEMDVPNPLNVYGRSKLAGERAVQQVGGQYLILRTSWVYSMRRDSFVTKVLEWARKQNTLRVVDDQVSNPTWCRMLAEVTAHLLAKAEDHPVGWLADHSGLYHLAGSGRASRYHWAQAILACDPRRQEQVVEEIVPAKTSEFPTPARRPTHSALNCERFSDVFGLSLPDWRDALKLAMEND